MLHYTMMGEMAPGVRSQIIARGSCVEEAASLFDRLDSGSGNTEMRRRAGEVCMDCDERAQCLSRLSKYAIRFAQAGVEETVIGGAVLESSLPRQSQPEAQPANKRTATRERHSRSYWQDGKLHQIEYQKLPAWFLSEFSAAEPGNLLASVRKLARERNSRHGISGHIWNKHGLRLRPYITDLRLPSELFSSEDSENMQNAICKFYSRIELNRDTFRDPDIRTLRLLTDEYIRDAVAIKDLGFGNVLSVAFSYAPSDYMQALEEPRYAQHLTRTMVRQAFEQNANAPAMLDRFCEWFPEAQAQYAGHPIVTEGAMRHLVLRAARQADKARVEEHVGGFLGRFDVMQRLCVHMPFVRDHNIRGMALSCSSPQEAIEALEERRREMQQLATIYGLGEHRANRMVTRYRTDLEGKIQRYQKNVKELRQQFEGHSDLTLTDLMYFAEHNAASPELAVRNFLNGLSVLRNAYPGDEIIDNDVKRAIAQIYMENPLLGAERYLENYQTLKERFGDDDYLQDWMLRKAALKPRTSNHSLIERISYFRRLAKRGDLNVALDEASTNTRSQRGIIASDTVDPEQSVIDAEERTNTRVEIDGALLQLTKAEREAVIHTFSLDWLFSDEVASAEDVAKELNIATGDLESYTHKCVVPKLKL